MRIVRGEKPHWQWETLGSGRGEMRGRIREQHRQGDLDLQAEDKS